MSKILFKVIHACFSPKILESTQLCLLVTLPVFMNKTENCFLSLFFCDKSQIINDYSCRTDPWGVRVKIRNACVNINLTSVVDMQKFHVQVYFFLL